MPTPIKERYQLQGVTRLPCDDRKVADTVACDDFYVYCTDVGQKLSVTIQGAGEILTIDQTCGEFMSQAANFNWGNAEDLLMSDYSAFSTQYNEGANRKTFSLNNASFTNKYGTIQRGGF